MTLPPRVLSLPGGEPLLHYGAAAGPQLLVLQPLFEEMNRCRALVAALCRRLAARGFGCWLPDLPGCGESERALEGIGWDDWTDTIMEADRLIARETGQAPAGTIAIRGGALLDMGATRRWRLSPVSGASLLTDLRRSGLLASGAYAFADTLHELLSSAEPEAADPETRTIRLVGDERPCDLSVEGPTLWRRPEPLAAPELASILAQDIDAWLAGETPVRPELVEGPPFFRPKRKDSASTGSAQTDIRVSGERRVVAVPLDTGWLQATLDGPAAATAGWVFVTGGTQTRVGPHRLYERLAHHLAGRGAAVIRFDRPGVGDSPGADAGYLDSGAGIAAAVQALCDAFPQVSILSGFGLCDGATALALHGRAAGIARLVVANPWVVEPTDDLPPAAAIRGYYARRLLDPRAWWKLARGGVNLGRLARGVARSASRDDAALAERFARGVPVATTVVLARDDGTAQAFEGAWRQLADAPAIETITIATASHSFAEPAAFEALANTLARHPGLDPGSRLTGATARDSGS